MVQAIRTIKEMLRASKSAMCHVRVRTGMPTDEDVSKEVQQAQVLLRENLITLGEGFRFNFAFTYYDYRMDGSRTGYGTTTIWSRRAVRAGQGLPEAVAPAYAAQSLLLDGCEPAGPSSGSARASGATYSSGPATGHWLSGPTGHAARDLHSDRDHAGSRLRLDGQRAARGHAGGSLRLKLGPEPIYVTGFRPGYGAARRRRRCRSPTRRYRRFRIAL